MKHIKQAGVGFWIHALARLLVLFVADIATTQYITELALSGVVDNGHWYPPRGTPMYADFEKYRYFRTVRFIHRMLCFLDVWMFFVVAGSVDDWQWTVELTEECIWLVTVLSYGFVHCSPPNPLACSLATTIFMRTQHRIETTTQQPRAPPDACCQSCGRGGGGACGGTPTTDITCPQPHCPSTHSLGLFSSHTCALLSFFFHVPVFFNS